MKNFTRKVNVALQVLPRSSTKDTYELVDKAIEIIETSGIKHTVCPFETVMEGNYNKIREVIDRALQACMDEGAEEMLAFVKIQINKNDDVTIEEKTGKYKK